MQWISPTAARETAAYRLHVLGMVYYRTGDYPKAIHYLELSNASPWTEPSKALNYIVLAMAHQQAGRPDNAQRSMKMAEELVGHTKPKTPDGPVQLFAPDWIEYQVLSREAVDLLKKSEERIQCSLPLCINNRAGL